jgi:glutaredoxin
MKVEIYSKDFCVYCDMAKNLMESRGIGYTEYKLGNDGITREMLFERVPNARTFPQIIINDQVIGGWTQFKSWMEEHESSS